MAGHRWRFFRAGGLDQVRLERGEDIERLAELDQKLWVALACPVDGLECDRDTLALIDTDHDGRVRAPEILAAIAFCRQALRSLDTLIAEGPELPLAAVREDTDLGRRVLQSSRRVLRALDKADAPSIGLADLADTDRIFANTRLNGDGVLTPRSSDDPAVVALIEAAMRVVATRKDRSGVEGVHEDELKRFFDELAAWQAWTLRGRDPDVRPLGDATPAAAAALLGVKAKIDDYFVRCRLAAYDPAATGALNPTDAQVAAVAAKALSAGATEATDLPIARVEAGRALDLHASVNPAYAAAMEAFVRDAVRPVLGERAVLTEEEWTRLRDSLAPHLAWSAAKPATKAEELPPEDLDRLLLPETRAALDALLVLDRKEAEDFDAISVVAQLVRYHRDLYPILRNFVSFVDFYAPGRLAVFQAGVLYLDSRSVELCVKVTDVGKHAGMALLSKCYIAYCDCVRKDGSRMQIAAIFTAGDSDYLMVGRNGVFYDRLGRDWDATITRIVENPISLREAFFAPYKKAIRMVEEQITKRAAAADSAPLTGLVGSVTTTGAPPPKPAGSFDLSTIALIGVAASGAAAVLGGLLQAFFGLGIWMPLGILAVILLISGPSVLIAGLKLSQRNLGPVLDANGWAVNGRVKVNIPLGTSLTGLRHLPPGSEQTWKDPYEQKNPWKLLFNTAAALLVLGLFTLLGYHQGWLPGVVEARLAFLGVPHHLVLERDRAQAQADEAKAAATSAAEQAKSTKEAFDAMVAAGAPEDDRLARARGRVERADARLVRAEDKLDRAETDLEVAADALDVATEAWERNTDQP